MSNENETIQLLNDMVKETLNKIAREHLKTTNYKKVIEKGSSKGDNFIGILYRVHLEAEKNDYNRKVNKENQTSIIVKVSPKNEARRKQFCARATFLREISLYNEIIPSLLNFQKSRGITPIIDDGFYEVPHCYTTISSDGNETIFLEDLRPKGFLMFNRLNELDYDHVRLIMKSLGKFHALSFAMKDQMPDEFSKLKFENDIFQQLSEEFDRSFFNSKKRVFEVLSSDLILTNKVKDFFGDESPAEIILNRVSGKNAEPYAVICHGDSWNNNFLYKYKDNKPIEAYLIDWQISRYASPVCDLVYFIFACTTKELRDKHYNDFLNIYHNELSTLLKKLGSDPEKVFPKNALNEQLRKFGSFGFLMAMLIIPFLTSNTEDVPDIDEMVEKMKEDSYDYTKHFGSTQVAYTKRMRDVVVDMIEFGYI